MSTSIEPFIITATTDSFVMASDAPATTDTVVMDSDAHATTDTVVMASDAPATTDTVVMASDAPATTEFVAGYDGTSIAYVDGKSFIVYETELFGYDDEDDY
jgi:hypothetical protein